jgi:hypothetical protein
MSADLGRLIGRFVQGGGLGGCGGRLDTEPVLSVEERRSPELDLGGGALAAIRLDLCILRIDGPQLQKVACLEEGTELRDRRAMGERKGGMAY